MTTQILFPLDTPRTRPECASPGCHRDIHRGELCTSHFVISRDRLPNAENVWIARRLANVKWIDGCLVWQGAPNNMGYGKVSAVNEPGASGREEAVHRWFYRRFVGPIPDGLVLDHLCRTPLCVNVMHLEPVTLAENTRRGFESRGFGTTRTHCKYGHPWVPQNIRQEPGKRPGLYAQKCRICKTEQDSARHKARRSLSIEGATK